MKIRNSFVSNSSSTSYVIEKLPTLTSKHTCSHCGHQSPDMSITWKVFYGRISSGQHGYSGEETKIDNNKEGLINEAEEQLKASEERLILLKDLPLDKLYPPRNRYGTTVGQARKWGQAEKEAAELQLAILSSTDGEVIALRISYHDDVTQSLLNELADNKAIRILATDGTWECDLCHSKLESPRCWDLFLDEEKEGE